MTPIILYDYFFHNHTPVVRIQKQGGVMRIAKVHKEASSEKLFFLDAFGKTIYFTDCVYEGDRNHG